MSIPSSEFFEQFNRLKSAAGVKTQYELAQVLGIRQSSVSEAKSRGHIPADWLLTLLMKERVNPEWVLWGRGMVYLTGLESEQNGERTDGDTFRKFLKLVPFAMILDELAARFEEKLRCSNGPSL